MATFDPVGENLWSIDGPVVHAYGLAFPTRMVIARLTSGALWVWSPIHLDEDLRQAVKKLGEPRYVVEPNKLHHLALSAWLTTWPALQLFAPPGLAKKRRDVRFTADLSDEPPPEWRGQIDQVCVRGNVFMTEVVFFHRASSTCLVGDLIQKHDVRGLPTWRRWVTKAAGVAGRDGGTPLDGRLTFVHRDAARDSIVRVLTWSPRHLVIAHGPCFTEGGVDVLRRSFQWLLQARV
jgi:hypothetical protein